MGNTERENAQIKSAVFLITNKYAAFMSSNKSLAQLLSASTTNLEINGIVKFVDGAKFMNVYSSNGMRPSSSRCRINGFTDLMCEATTGSRVVYINRSTYSPSTLIHELLHFFCHRDFHEKFASRPDIVEGVTEYFTRKVQRHTDSEKFDAFKLDRKGIYDEELENVSLARSVIRREVDKDQREAYMKSAYFLGLPGAMHLLDQTMGGGEV